MERRVSMEDWLQRTRALLGNENIDKLAGSKVCVFGVGGVGGYVCEALARSGVGEIVIVDNDTVNVTNINRQIIATNENVGRLKVDVMQERLLSINPDIKVTRYPILYTADSGDLVDIKSCSYIVDAVDHVPAKVEIALRAKSLGIPVISSMGAGNKLDPTRFRVSDIYKTSVCPLAKIMRHKLREAGIERLKVVFSDEVPHTTVSDGIIPSIAFAPSVAGLVIASEVVKDICGI